MKRQERRAGLMSSSQLWGPRQVPPRLLCLGLTSKIRKQDEKMQKAAVSVTIFMSSQPFKTWCLQQHPPSKKKQTKKQKKPHGCEHFFNIPFTYNGNKLKIIGLMFTNPLNIYWFLS